MELADQTGQSFIHPYDDPYVICGQATLGVEILRQCDEDTQFIFVPVGGGGLAAGVALAVKYLRPDIRMIGVEADESASMRAALAAGEPVDLEELGHFAEGVAVRRTGALTFGICRHLLDDLIAVDSDEICAAIQDIYEDTRAIAEPAGALALAGVKKYFAQHPQPGARVATVLSGANVNFARLRHIAERAAVGEESEILLGVTIPERPGSFLDFCEVVGLRGITEFNYRYADEAEAHIFVGIALRDTIGEKNAIIDSLNEHRFPVADLSSNNMARLHIRHMVGGRANVADERVLRFEFPERPGALLKFLQGMQSDWNISLFHYRNYGSEYGRILMGIQVPDEDMVRFEQFLGATGYHYHYEADNEAFRLFVGSAGQEAGNNLDQS
jgi:threonine dehydratase